MMCMAGGALDSNAFRKLAQAKQVPPPSSITYEGLFNENWFLNHKAKDEKETEKKDFLITPVSGYATFTAVEEEGKPRRQLAACFMRSPLDGKERTLGLNLVIALDVSGSMSESLTTPKTEADLFNMKTKLQLAHSAIHQIVDQLRDGDRFGLVTFNEEAQVVQDLEAMTKLDKNKLKNTVSSTKSGGGTVIMSAITAANQLISKIAKDIDHASQETRIIFVTDMCDSSRETNNLLQSIQKNANQGIFTSVIGVGIDFNTDVTQEITKVKGANYLSCFTEEEFLSALARNFSFNYFPFAFDMQLRMAVNGTKGEPYIVTQVYGTPFTETATAPICDKWTPKTHALYPKSFRAVVLTFLMAIHRRRFSRLPLPVLSLVMSFINPATCCLVEVNTSFPSEVKDNHIYGGTLLVQIEKAKENDQGASSESVLLKLRVTFTDRAGKEQGNETTLAFEPLGEQKDYYSSFAVKKAVLLQRYVYSTQQFLIAHHEKKKY